MPTTSAMPLRHRLILWCAAILIIVLTLFGALLYGITRWTLVRVLDDTLMGTIDQAMANAAAIPTGEFSTPEEMILRLPKLDMFRSSAVYIQAWRVDENGVSLAGASSNIEDYPNALDPVALQEEAATSSEHSTDIWSEAMMDGTEWRVISRPVDIWGQTFVLQAAISLASVNQMGRWLLIIIVVEMALALVGTCFIGWTMASRALGRIDDITEAAASIVNTDDLKTRMPATGPNDEIGRLISVFNHMLDRIEHMFGVQQRFVADVSHELRTPLTAIRGHLDLIKRYGVDPESLDALDSEVARMNRLVTDLLMLAKADYGGLTLTMGAVDLDDLVTEVYREAKILAKDRDLKVTIRDYEPVRIQGDHDRLKQLLLNLISNAIKFTPDGGEITLNLRQTPNDAVLEVSDTGIGISEDDHKHVFDRFFQSDTSRARGDFGALAPNEGVGLGLSIARWITEAHGGHISVHSQPGHGATFTATFPRQIAHAAPQTAARPRIAGLIRRERTGEHTAAQ
ncbi:MAG: two-component sensor histidine kinase [Chloroflexi bacterium OLB15]|nr:MAG: two-component sensor histidine kinase [Chloroflexi bacterium OLB15]